jgi:hypothetical protein
MNWMLRLYPARWRARYGEEFGAVLASQRASVGLIVDVVGGAIDAHLHPQILGSDSKQIKGDDTMTLEMLHRCAIGGPKLSPDERRIASRLSIVSALVIAALYLVLTKIYRQAPAVQALYWTSIFFPNIIYRQTVYLRKRFWLTHALMLGAGLSAMYLFMLAVFLLASKL